MLGHACDHGIKSADIEPAWCGVQRATFHPTRPWTLRSKCSRSNDLNPAQGRGSMCATRLSSATSSRRVAFKYKIAQDPSRSPPQPGPVRAGQESIVHSLGPQASGSAILSELQGPRPLDFKLRGGAGGAGRSSRSPEPYFLRAHTVSELIQIT
eukprot:442905-Rhodomonas_salina.1